MKVIGIIFFLFFPLMTNVCAYTIFSDDFNRTSLGTAWSSYIERDQSSGGSVGISNNKLVINNGGDEKIGDNFAYTDLGATFDQAVITGEFTYTRGTTSDDESLYIGLNANVSEIMYDEEYGADSWYTYGKGYAFQMNPAGSYFINDTSGTTGNLKSGTTAFSVSTTYSFEIQYFADKRMEVRFWTGTRPSTANVFYTPGTVPTYSGTYLTFGITDEGTFTLDNIMVTSDLPLGGVPEPSSFIMLGICIIGLAGIARKK